MLDNFHRSTQSAEIVQALTLQANRTVKSVMRHSEIVLAMDTFADKGLLDATGRVQRLPDLPLGKPLSVTPDVTPTTGNFCRNWQNLHKMTGPARRVRKRKKPSKTRVLTSGQYWIRTGDLCRVKAAL